MNVPEARLTRRLIEARVQALAIRRADLGYTAFPSEEASLLMRLIATTEAAMGILAREGSR